MLTIDPSPVRGPSPPVGALLPHRDEDSGLVLALDCPFKATDPKPRLADPLLANCRDSSPHIVLDAPACHTSDRLRQGIHTRPARDGRLCLSHAKRSGVVQVREREPLGDHVVKLIDGRVCPEAALLLEARLAKSVADLVAAGPDWERQAVRQ